MCAHMCTRAQAIVHTQRSEDNFWEWVLPYHPVNLGGFHQVVRLGGKCLSPLLYHPARSGPAPPSSQQLAVGQPLPPGTGITGGGIINGHYKCGRMTQTVVPNCRGVGQITPETFVDVTGQKPQAFK